MDSVNRPTTNPSGPSPRDGYDPDRRDPEHIAHLVAFARRWLPYGGGSRGDILVEFGLTEDEYFTRLLAVLPEAGLDPTTTTHLHTLATRRLTTARDRHTA